MENLSLEAAHSDQRSRVPTSLYKITCKHVYEIGKTQIFKFSFERTQRFQKTLKKKKNCFSFNILESIKTFWNITTCKMFMFKNSSLKLISHKFAIWNYLFVWPTTIAIPPKPGPMKSSSPHPLTKTKRKILSPLNAC